MSNGKRSELLLAFAFLVVLTCCHSTVGQRTKDRTLTPREIAQATLPSTVSIFASGSAPGKISMGSGFFVTADTVATSYHVIEGESEIFVEVYGRNARHRVLRIAALDAENDLVLLKVGGIRGKPLKLDQKAGVGIGESIFVVSNPQGLEGTFSPGIVSSIRNFNGNRLLQITAPISPGSSGGAVLNEYGAVIGIAKGAITSGQALNFAVPVDLLRLLVSVETKRRDLVSSSSLRTLFPALAVVQPPGISGTLVESLDGGVVVEGNATQTFNPGSSGKIATAYAILKVFGPDFRFLTNVYADGAIDYASGTLQGNLYISGKDPIFGSQHGVILAHELNALGIRKVAGNLVVAEVFSMNFERSASVSSQLLHSTLDGSTRSNDATKQWTNYLKNSRTIVSAVPSVSVEGRAIVGASPGTVKHLFTHGSSPSRNILKVMLCYSNDFLAERLGALVGGPYSVERLVHREAGVSSAEFSFNTTRRGGTNRITPNAMMKLIRALRSTLARDGLTFTDVMPVAGIDEGILGSWGHGRYSPGSVVGMASALSKVEGGISAFTGELNTSKGRLLFVLFNQKGSVSQFRAFQDYFVDLVQSQFGGGKAIPYPGPSLEVRLSDSRIIYPKAN